MNYTIINLSEHENLIEQASHWFHQKWGILQEAYLESMNECISHTSAIPQWYIVMNHTEIIAGVGVIENDFHNRKDLTPNLCALYVEQDYRNQGIAGHLLEFVCKAFQAKGIDTLYLITDHTSFYEKYNWEFLCMVQGDDEPQLTRMYVHKKE